MKSKKYSLIVLVVVLFVGICIITTANNKRNTKYQSKHAISHSDKQANNNDKAVDIIKSKPIGKNKTGIIYQSNNTKEGIIGSFSKKQEDNPYDNIFPIILNQRIANNCNVYLEYELSGLQDYTSVCKSVNDQLASGGYFVQKKEGWSKQSEQLNPEQLKNGKNIIRFTLPENAQYAYKVRNVCLRVQATANKNEARKLVVNQPNTFAFFQKYGYIQGFVSGQGSEKAKLTVNAKPFQIINGTFEGLTEKNNTEKNVWKATVIAQFEDGMQLKTDVVFKNPSQFDYTYNTQNQIKHTELTITPITKINLDHDGLKLSGDTQSIAVNANLSATTLRSIDMPCMQSGMVNVTGEGKGFRLLPHGTKFQKDLSIQIKYDTTQLPVGYQPSDIKSFYYDETAMNWIMLPCDSVDKKNCMVISHTNHFTDFINAIIKTPELPETQAYTPTSMKDIKVANPLEGINLIAPPAANNMGTANISFPIEIPAGRQGIQPNLSLQYNSAGGNGWMGLGWDLSVPAITVETRWGVPLYSPYVESESYLMSGEQLTPQVQRSAFVSRQTNKQFYPRIEGAFNKIIRHGTLPSNYWWTVTDRNGVTYYYGKRANASSIDPTAVLIDANNNIAHWALTEIRDLNGNFVQYEYDIEPHSGVPGGITGKQIYIKKITYTNYNDIVDGKYSVEFERENLATYTRPDIQITARYGFKEVTAHLLKIIKVKYDNVLIRKYHLVYKEGRFNKTLLCKIVEENTDSPTINTQLVSNILDCNESEETRFPKGTKRHKFEYYDDIHSSHFAAPIDMSIDTDNESTGTIGPISTSPIGSTKSHSPSGGGGVSVGIGWSPFSKSNSVGGNYNYSASTSEGIVAFTDIDGDGLPDKVFKKDNRLWYRKLKPNMITYDSPRLLGGAPGNFMTEKSTTDTWGLEGHLGWSVLSVNGSGNESQTESFTKTYFADANGDGLVDIINEGDAYLNQIQSNGIPHFVTTTSDIVYVGDNTCEYIIHSGFLNDSITIHSSRKYPTKFKKISNESVRLWIAPESGSVNITSSIQLIEDTSYARKQSHYADGIKYIIQHKNLEILYDTIHANNYASKAANYSSLSVNKGDNIYFRLQSQDNRSYDNVIWDPRITYVGKDTSKIDADSKSIYTYKASDDFLLNTKNSTTMPLKGKVIIRGSLIAPALSDTLRFQIYRNNVLYKEKVFQDGTAINYTLDTLINVDTNNVFTFFAKSNTNVNWTAVQSKFRMLYTYADSVTIDTSSIYKSINFRPNIIYSLYQEDIKPSNPYSLVADTATAYPYLQYSNPTSANGEIILAIKKKDYLIAKKKLIVQNGSFVGNASLQFNNSTAGNVYFEFYTDSINFGKRITSASVTVNSSNIDAGVHAVVADTMLKFGNLYRHWGQFCYKPDTIITKIEENKLTLGSSYSSIDTNSTINTGSINSYADLQAFFASNNYPDPINQAFSMMTPDLDSNVWRGFGDITMVGANKMSNVRKRLDTLSESFDYPIPVVINSGKKWGPYKHTFVNNESYNESLGLSCFDAGSSQTNSNVDLLIDYMDLNGDRYPDAVGTDYIQYTTPQGGLSSPRPNNTLGINNNNSSAIGATFGTTFPINKPSTSSSGNPKKPNNSVSGSSSVGSTTGDDETQYTMADVNGDGLPDMVFKGGFVRMNLGYSFAGVENWNNVGSFSQVRDGSSSNENLGLSFNIFENSFSLGLGLSWSSNENKNQMIDVNGDGLQDMVRWTNTGSSKTMEVALNTGTSFKNFELWHSNNQPLANSKTYNESGNATITAGFVIPIPLIFIIIPLKFPFSASVCYSSSLTNEKMQLIDMNADGYVDYVTSDDANEIKVRYSTLGKLNILKKVINSAGGSFELTYNLSTNTQRSPQRNWQMDTVIVHDGHAGDGADSTFTTYEYKNPYYSRFERISYGYDTVITHFYNTFLTNPTVYRTIKEAYHTNSFLFKGLKKYEVLLDSVNNKYVETFYTYRNKRISTGLDVPDELLTCYVDYYPAIAKEDKYFYEGFGGAGIHTQKLYTHGAFGNVVQYTDLGDVNDDNDNITADILYNPIISQNLLSLASSIVVTNTNNEDILRSRTATYDQNTGKPLEFEIINTDHINAVYNYTYDLYGNVAFAMQPRDQNQERKIYKYTYDNITHTYPVEISDEEGYVSTTGYDLRFGKPNITTDISGNDMKYTYDGAGRTKTIRAPYELDANVPYTIKFDYWDDHDLPSYSAANIPKWARTSHYDSYDSGNKITTILFTDAMGKVLQTKKKAVIYDPSTATETEVMIVSGKVIYDAYGRAISTTYPITEDLGQDSIFNDNVDTQLPTTTQYDVMDRPVAVTTPDQITSYTAYDFGNDYSHTTRFKTTQTDALNNQTMIYTDARGLKTTITDAKGGNTNFVYNAIGELLSSTDPEDKTTEYFYNALGHRVQRIHPDAGTTSYTYDPAGNMISMQTQNLLNQALDIEYHYKHNRLRKIDYPLNPENNVYYRYGDHNSGNQAGRIIKQQDATGAQDFYYGKMGELTRNIHTFVSPGSETYTFETNWTYDSWNRIHQIIYPDGEIVNYRYNKGGQLRSMDGKKTIYHYNYINLIGYDKYEKRLNIQYGNNTYANYTYNPLTLQLSNLTSYNSQNIEMQNIDYTYDNVDNITQITNNAQDMNGMGGTYNYNYSYDNLYRLTSANGSWQNYGFEMGMGYSASGNITNKTQTGNTFMNGTDVYINYNRSYNYNNNQPHTLQQINGGELNFSWDANGNLITYNNTNSGQEIYRIHCWDEENRLSAVRDQFSLSHYTYDAAGERVWKHTGQVEQMQINGEQTIDFVNLDNITLYANSYMTINDHEYTKHYYTEGQRVCSRLGGGMLNNYLTDIHESVNMDSIGYDLLIEMSKNKMYRDFECVGFDANHNLGFYDAKFNEHLNKQPYYDNAEPDLYFYHSDHLGSSSFITDSGGMAIQHLQYLPYGELFVEQRKDVPYVTPYKFSAKEKDEETGYSYFGARYYMPEISIWNSVDPLADNHPNVSAFAYCNWNPLVLIDPDGKDWFENEKSGAVYYNSNMKKGSEGTGAMQGEGWKHMGKNNMFQKNENDLNNDVSVISKNADLTSSNDISCKDGKVNTEAMFEGKKAESFMDKMGYKILPTQVTEHTTETTTDIIGPNGKKSTFTDGTQTRYGEKFGYFPKNSEEIGTVTIGAPKERGSIFSQSTTVSQKAIIYSNKSFDKFIKNASLFIKGTTGKIEHHTPISIHSKPY